MKIHSFASWAAGGQQPRRSFTASALAARIAVGIASASISSMLTKRIPAGACAIFSCLDTCADFPVISIFNQQEHLPDYESHPAGACPMCAKGEKLDGIVNSFGVSALR